MCLVILGGGTFLLEIKTSLALEIEGFFEDDPEKCLESASLSFLGNFDEGCSLVSRIQCSFLIAIPDTGQRITLSKQLPKSCVLPSVIHPSLLTHGFYEIGDGSILLENTVLHTGVILGEHCIVFPDVIIGAGSRIDSFCNIGVGVRIGRNVHIASGSWIENGAWISDEVILPAGSHVVLNTHISTPPTFIHPPQQNVTWNANTKQKKTIISGHHIRHLETYLAEILEIDMNQKCVIAVNSATAGLHALCLACQLYHRKHPSMTWITQSFSHHRTIQGPFSSSTIINDLEWPFHYRFGEAEGWIVTNCFGTLISNLSEIISLATQHQILLVMDNSNSPLAKLDGKNSLNFGDGGVVDFQHDNPLGYGDGGVIIASRKYEPILRGLIDESIIHNHAYKFGMSDPVALALFTWLTDQSFQQVVIHHYYYLAKIWYQIVSPSLRFPSITNPNTLFLSCLPLLWPTAVPLSVISLTNQETGIECRKYYSSSLGEPSKFPIAHNISNRILCFPCHLDITKLHLISYYHRYLPTMERILKSTQGL